MWYLNTRKNTIFLHVKISIILLTPGLSLKLYLNSLEYHRNIFGSSSKVLGNLPKSSDIFRNFRKFSENVRERSSGLRDNLKNFGNLRKVVGNLRKIIKNAVISMFQGGGAHDSNSARYLFRVPMIHRFMTSHPVGELLLCFCAVSYTHLTLPTKRIV